jgi:hypothetical protein
MREQEERTSVAADGDPKQSVPDPSGGTGLRSLVVLLSICNVCCGAFPWYGQYAFKSGRARAWRVAPRPVFGPWYLPVRIAESNHLHAAVTVCRASKKRTCCGEYF